MSPNPELPVQAEDQQTNHRRLETRLLSDQSGLVPPFTPNVVRATLAVQLGNNVSALVKPTLTFSQQTESNVDHSHFYGQLVGFWRIIVPDCLERFL